MRFFLKNKEIYLLPSYRRVFLLLRVKRPDFLYVFLHYISPVFDTVPYDMPPGDGTCKKILVSHQGCNCFYYF